MRPRSRRGGGWCRREVRRGAGPIKVEQAWRRRETFPRAKVVRLEGCGHWPMFDDPDRLAGAVVPYLAEQLAPVTAT